MNKYVSSSPCKINVKINGKITRLQKKRERKKYKDKKNQSYKQEKEEINTHKNVANSKKIQNKRK